jgi:DNA-binding Lrp family transcriptional regulator
MFKKRRNTLVYMLDLLDYRLARVLKEDGRTSTKVLSKIIGISEPTVRTRLKRLRELGILRITVSIDLDKVVEGVIGFVGIKAKAYEIQKLIEDLSKIVEVDNLYRTMGEYDILAMVSARDMKSLQFVFERLSSLGGIVTLSTSIFMDTPKNKGGFTIRPGFGVKIPCHVCGKEVVEDSNRKPLELGGSFFCSQACLTSYNQSLDSTSS